MSFGEPVDPGGVSPANFVAAGPGASIVSVAGVGAMVDGGYTGYNIGVTGSGEGVLAWPWTRRLRLRISRATRATASRLA